MAALLAEALGDRLDPRLAAHPFRMPPGKFRPAIDLDNGAVCVLATFNGAKGLERVEDVLRGFCVRVDPPEGEEGLTCGLKSSKEAQWVVAVEYRPAAMLGMLWRGGAGAAMRIADGKVEELRAICAKKKVDWMAEVRRDPRRALGCQCDLLVSLSFWRVWRLRGVLMGQQRRLDAQTETCGSGSAGPRVRGCCITFVFCG